jgi:hypothetical protein
MRAMARSTGVRIFAVLMLLALRPCLIATGVALDNARSNHPVLQYIAVEEAVHHVAHNREVWLPGPAAITALGAAILTALLIKLPEFFAAIVDPIVPALEGAAVEVFGSRAPPF